MITESRHQCLVYEGSPSKKLPVFAEVIQRKLEEGYRCLYLNSAPMVAGMRSTLAALGVDVVTEIAKARLVLSSEPVSPGGEFNSEAMLGKLEDALNQALDDGYKGLWASGDMTWEFGPEKDFSKLLDYELGLEEIFSRRPELCGICQYHKDSLPREALRKSVLAHTTFVTNDTLTLIDPQHLKATSSADLYSETHEFDDLIAALCGSR